ncbi:hypothetical protein U9R62_10380 [Cylindrospermopsis raciborskii DSH]|uniref:hypothetical protein n=1 Tax=Cylindrospermopsis raciborskii TaxID=77022 RepID=UPI002ED8D5B5
MVYKRPIELLVLGAPASETQQDTVVELCNLARRIRLFLIVIIITRYRRGRF